jgi:isoleucyl-tRNA synthetase
MQREPFVVDCWLDSGLAHTAGVDYLQDPTLFESLFPYDFITEAVDQARGWFYSLLYTSVVWHDSVAFKACVSQEHVLDADGQKMSKSKGNVVWAADALKEVGADPFRVFVLTKNASWTRTNYVPKELQLVQKRLDVLWNVVLFADTYMNLDKFVFNEKRLKRNHKSADMEDRWLLSRVQTVVEEFHKYMREYLWHQAGRVLLEFMTEDVSRVYLPLVKKRVWLDSDNPKKLMAYDVMYFALDRLLRCLNVFTPFLCEKLHKDFLRSFSEGLPESVNMRDLPEPENSYKDSELEATFDVLQELRSASSHARNKKGVKLRHPVAKVVLAAESEEAAERALSLSSLLLDDLNTREFEAYHAKTTPDFVGLAVKPNFRQLGPKFKDKMKRVVTVLESTDPSTLRDELKKGSVKLDVDGEEVELESTDLEFEETLPDHLSSAESRYGMVYVDVTRTRELEAEGLVRDMTRRVQVMRKELDLKVEQAVELLLQLSDEESVELAEMYRDYLSTETRADSLELVGPEPEPKWQTYSYVKEWEVDDLTLKVGMTPKE